MPTLIAILIFAAWFAFAFLKPRTAFSLLPFALPFYLVRLSIGPLPTTALEMVVLAMIGGWLLSIFLFTDEKSHRVERDQIPNPKSQTNLKSQISKQDPMRCLELSRVQRDGIWNLKNAWHSFRPWLLPSGLWLLAGAVSVVVAPDHLPALGLYRAYFVEPIALFFVAFGIWHLAFGEESQMPNAKCQMLLRNLFLLTIFFGLWAIFQYLTGIGLPAEYAPAAIRRAVGPFPYPNALALFVVPIVALALAERIRAFGIWHLAFGKNEPPNAKRQTPNATPAWLEWLTVIAGLAAVLLAKSDGGLIALIAAAFVALLMNKRTRIAAIAVAVIGTIAIFAIPQVKTPVMNQILFKEWSGKVRVIMWKETVTMLKDRPILGAGLSGYPTAIVPYHKATWMEIFQYPHNILLNLWSETGILGVVAFGWMLWVWAYSLQLTAYSRKNFSAVSCKPLAISLPVITALLVHGLVDVPYFKNDLAILFFFLILITLNETIQHFPDESAGRDPFEKISITNSPRPNLFKETPRRLAARLTSLRAAPRESES